jgi:hypothetical protein
LRRGQVEGVAEPLGLGPLDQLLDELVVNAVLDEEPAASATALV